MGIVGEGIQQGFRSGAQPAIVFGKNEPALHHFHRTVRQALDLVLPRARVSDQLYGAPSLALDSPVDRAAPVALDLEAVARGELKESGLAPLWNTERPSAIVRAERVERRLT